MVRRTQRSAENTSKEHILPEAELEVLATLHALGEVDAVSVLAAMKRFRPMTHASMATLLKRLEAKGLVSRRKGDVGKAFVYRATVKPNSTYRSVLRRMVERLFHGEPLAMVSALFDARPPTADEIDELRRMVNDLSEKRKGKA